MKYIQTIATLIERASRNGAAKISRRSEYGMGWFYSNEKAPLQEVYRVEFDKNTDQWKLFHYETLTAWVDLKENKILTIYGESRSDADSLETFFHELGMDNLSFGYRPSNGGFYCRVDNQSDENYIYFGGYDTELFTKDVTNRIEELKNLKEYK